MHDHWPYVVMLAGAAITYFWRALGVALAGRLRPDGRLFDWVGCIAYALLADLISRMIVLPIGPLSETTLGARLVYSAHARANLLGTRLHEISSASVRARVWQSVYSTGS